MDELVDGGVVLHRAVAAGVGEGPGEHAALTGLAASDEAGRG